MRTFLTFLCLFLVSCSKSVSPTTKDNAVEVSHSIKGKIVINGGSARSSFDVEIPNCDLANPVLLYEAYLIDSSGDLKSAGLAKQLNQSCKWQINEEILDIGSYEGLLITFGVQDGMDNSAMVEPVSWRRFMFEKLNKEASQNDEDSEKVDIANPNKN